MEYLFEVGVFAAKIAVIVAGFLVVIIGIALLVSRKQQEQREHLDIYNLGEKLTGYANLLKMSIFTKKEWKEELKRQKEDLKSKSKNEKTEKKARVFVLEFDGDMKADQVDRLRQEVSILILAMNQNDEVIVKIESPGGMVHGYGLAAAQLMRFRQKSIPLTVCVDKVAASGGYLMACTGDRILAAPFAIVGSIGVVAQVPNFNRFLKKHNVDYEEITAGEYKRTISMLGEITDKGRRKFTEQIEDTHLLFKEFVHKCRPQLNLATVATGEHWFGERALSLGLIDEIKTSDELVMEKMKEKDIFYLEMKEKKTLGDKLSKAFGQTARLIRDQLLRIFNYST
ncbi:MAG: protease SohB [Bdellovibrionales bacterium]|nr:protease SohB [Bdellovibrionales bacterium]